MDNVTEIKVSSSTESQLFSSGSTIEINDSTVDLLEKSSKKICTGYKLGISGEVGL